MDNAKSDVHDSPVADHLPKYASPEIKRANVKEGEKLMNDHINCRLDERKLISEGFSLLGM